jgi:hypothetical protein
LKHWASSTLILKTKKKTNNQISPKTLLFFFSFFVLRCETHHENCSSVEKEFHNRTAGKTTKKQKITRKKTTHIAEKRIQAKKICITSKHKCMIFAELNFSCQKRSNGKKKDGKKTHALSLALSLSLSKQGVSFFEPEN